MTSFKNRNLAFRLEFQKRRKLSPRWAQTHHAKKLFPGEAFPSRSVVSATLFNGDVWISVEQIWEREQPSSVKLRTERKNSKETILIIPNNVQCSNCNFPNIPLSFMNHSSSSILIFRDYFLNFFCFVLLLIFSFVKCMILCQLNKASHKQMKKWTKMQKNSFCSLLTGGVQNSFNSHICSVCS